MGDVLLDQPADQLGGRAAQSFVVEQLERGASGQIRPDLPHRGIEAQAGQLGAARTGIHVIRLLMNGDQKVGNLFMARKGRRYFTLMIVGVYFEQADAIRQLLGPIVQRLDNYEG